MAGAVFKQRGQVMGTFEHGEVGEDSAMMLYEYLISTRQPWDNVWLIFRLRLAPFPLAKKNSQKGGGQRHKPQSSVDWVIPGSAGEHCGQLNVLWSSTGWWLLHAKHARPKYSQCYGVTSLHSCLVLGRDSNKELSSIRAKDTSKGLWAKCSGLNCIGTKVKTRELRLSMGSLYR